MPFCGTYLLAGMYISHGIGSEYKTVPQRGLHVTWPEGLLGNSARFR